MSATDLAARIRAWYDPARAYDLGTMAAARLAAGSPLVLSKIESFVDPDGWIGWEKVAAFVDRSGWSSGEKSLIRFACSLTDNVAEDHDHCELWTVQRMLSSLDRENAALVQP